jgi:hypothetical protein
MNTYTLYLHILLFLTKIIINIFRQSNNQIFPFPIPVIRQLSQRNRWTTRGAKMYKHHQQQQPGGSIGGDFNQNSGTNNGNRGQQPQQQPQFGLAPPPHLTVAAVYGQQQQVNEHETSVFVNSE